MTSTPTIPTRIRTGAVGATALALVAGLLSAVPATAAAPNPTRFAALPAASAVATPAALAASTPSATIPAPDGSLWTDVDGDGIRAHGGSVVPVEEAEVGIDITGDGLLEDRVYLWYGEDKTNATRPVDGVRGYWSLDLEEWHDMGLVLPSHQFNALRVNGAGTAVEVDPAKVDAILEVAELDAPDGTSTQADIDAALAFVTPYVESWTDDGAPATYDRAALENAAYRLNGNINIMERPKMLWNAKTQKFVVIYHADGPLPTDAALVNWVSRGAPAADRNIGSRYSRAEIGFAVSDTPWGPFKLVNTTKMNWAPGVPAAGREGDSRDMTIFQDTGMHDVDPVADDAYAVYSSEMNRWMYVSRLNAEYTGPLAEADSAVLGEDFSNRVLPNFDREASSVFRYDGWYYMITSGTDGWASTPVIAYRSRTMITPTPAVIGDTSRHPEAGQWERIGNPCVGLATRTDVGTADPARCFDSQPTFVITVDQEAGEFIYMGDRWIVDSSTGSAGEGSRYVWAPIQIDTEQSTITVENVGAFDPSNATLYRPLAVSSTVTGSTDDLAGFDPAFDVAVGETTVTDQRAVWTPAALDAAFAGPGSATLGGVIIGDGPLGGRHVSVPVTVAGPQNLCRLPGSTVAASFSQTEYGTFPASNACDANGGTTWSTWASGTGKRDEVTYTISASGQSALSTVRLRNTEGVITAIGVEYRDATGTWRQTTAQNVEPAAVGAVTQIDFDEVVASGLRLTLATPGSFLKISEVYASAAVASYRQADVPVIAAELGSTATLPATVTLVDAAGDSRTAAVSWAALPSIVDGSAAAYTAVTATGTADVDGTAVPVQATVWPVPTGLVYLIDTGRVGANTSQLHTATKALLGDALQNEVSDRKVTTDADAWGYIERHPTDNRRVSVTAGDGVDWRTSFTGDDNDADEGLVYRITLDPGTYEITAAHVPRRTQTHGSWLNVGGTRVDVREVAVTQVADELRPPVLVTHEITLTERTVISYETQKLQASGGFNAHISLLAVQRTDVPVVAPAVSVEVAPRCVAGKPYLAVRVVNDDDVALQVGATSAHGSIASSTLAAGASVYRQFTVRTAALAAGTVTVTTTDADGRTFDQVVQYAATACR